MNSEIEKVKIDFKENLFNELIRVSCGKIEEEKAKSIAESVIDNMNINNPIFAHKGVSWLATEIKDMYGFC